MIPDASRPVIARSKVRTQLFVRSVRRKGAPIERHSVIRDPRMVDLDVTRRGLKPSPFHPDSILLEAGPAQGLAQPCPSLARAQVSPVPKSRPRASLAGGAVAPESVRRPTFQCRDLLLIMIGRGELKWGGLGKTRTAVMLRHP